MLEIRNVKFIKTEFYNMRCLVMFITAVCLLFLLNIEYVQVFFFSFRGGCVAPGGGGELPYETDGDAHRLA